jgi:hypothetical protein
MPVDAIWIGMTVRPAAPDFDQELVPMPVNRSRHGVQCVSDDGIEGNWIEVMAMLSRLRAVGPLAAESASTLASTLLLQ